MNNYYSISESDIVTALKLASVNGEDISPCFLQDNRRLKTILWNMGMDTKHSFTEHFCEHRNMSGEVVKCIRYEGVERIDTPWKESGYATTKNSAFAEEAQEMMMPNTSSTSSEYHLRRN